MRKALMYLLLALGIGLTVLFIGGALAGFAAGFLDGFNDAQRGTTDSKDLFLSSGMILVLLACVILQLVFLRLGYASYSVGPIPKEKRGLVIAGLVPAMAGSAIIYLLINNPLADPDETISSSYQWMKDHYWVSLIYLVLIEATADLILFGGVLREILTWKHRPILVLLIFATIMGLFSASVNTILLFIPGFAIALLEGYVYEYSRSIIPVIIADAVFWLTMLSLMGIQLSWWLYPVAAVLIVGGCYLAFKTMEPYKPID